MASLCVGTLSSPNNSLLYSQTKHLAATTRVSVTLPSTKRRIVRAAAIEKFGIKIDRNPPESTLTQLGVRQWNNWNFPPGIFPWTFNGIDETFYLLEGKMKVTPSGNNEAVEIATGDLVVFPVGMRCTLDVSEHVLYFWGSVSVGVDKRDDVQIEFL